MEPNQKAHGGLTLTPQHLVSMHSRARLSESQLRAHLDADSTLLNAMHAEHQRCSAVIAARGGRNCWIETRGHKILTELLTMAGST